MDINENVDTRKVDEVLVKIAKKFNEKSLLWGVGASKLMEKYDIGISEDIDFFVAKKHLDDAVKILSDIGEKIDIPFNANFLAKSSYLFKVDDVLVKVISGLNIRHNTGIYRYSFNTSSIDIKEEINEEIINYMALEDWFIIYQMIPGKVDCSKSILEYFKQKENINTSYLEKALKKALPKTTRNLLEKIIKFGL